MNCESVISEMGFSCRELGGGALRIWSPFTHGSDGEHIGLYVEPTNTGYKVTDNCEALMHASYAGVNLTPGRLDSIQKAVGHGARVSSGGEIVAYASANELGGTVAAVLNAAMAVAHFEGQWRPRMRAQSFSKEVEAVLENSLGDRVLRNVVVTGASGHQLELPLAVQTEQSLIYVQPIGTDDGKIDWQGVYAGWGRMTDIKNAQIEKTSRLIVLEDAANDAEMKRAIVVLTEAATVVDFRRLDAWARQRAA